MTKHHILLRGVFLLAKQPIWFTAREADKNKGYFEAVPIGIDPISGLTDYRVTIDDTVLVIRHDESKGIWHLAYRAIEAALYPEDDPIVD